MKKIAISLLALAACFNPIALAGPLQTAVLIRAIQIRTLASIRISCKTPQSTSVSALAVAKDGQASTSFERLKKISEENDRGRH